MNNRCRFLTSKARLEYYQNDLYLCLDNTLFQDEDGQIYLVPRNFVTDLYSIPNGLAWLVGDSAGRDPRPAILHDYLCEYHQGIRVKLTRYELINYGYLTIHYSKERNRGFIVCKDIPVEYLELTKMFSKGETNDFLRRAMKSLDVPKRKLIGGGICFNFNYLWSYSKLNLDNIYKIDNHYKR